MNNLQVKSLSELSDIDGLDVKFALFEDNCEDVQEVIEEFTMALDMIGNIFSLDHISE